MAQHPRRELFLNDGGHIGREDGLPILMGILNITPDSFSDGGAFLLPEKALDHAQRLIREGADILDIGAESARPGADAISPEEEWSRLAPILEGARGVLEIPISVDTVNVETARKALVAGATMINDISAGRSSNDEMLALVGEHDAALCVMHMQGTPKDMQRAPKYQNVIAEVYDFLAERRDAAVAAGIKPERLIVDPGFGFGKTHGHNVMLVRHLDRFRKLGLVLVGLSRKSSLGFLSGEKEDKLRLPESLAGAIIATLHGADIVRVHDVAETRRALRVSVPMGLS